MNILRPEDIRQQRYPKYDDFQQVVNAVRETIQDNPAFMGGLIAGSLTYGVPNVFSDMDGIALYQHGMAAEALQGGQTIAAIAQQHHVPITHFRLVSDAEARHGDHTVTKSFRAHLEDCQKFDEAIIKAPILEYFSQLPESLADSAMGYIQHKVQKLRRQLISQPAPWSDDWLELLEDLLSSPLDCAQRTLEAINDTCILVEAGSRTDIIKEFKATVRRYNLPVQSFLRILLRLESHRDYLVEQDWPMAASGDSQPYQARLHKVAAIGLEAYLSIGQLYDCLHQQLRSPDLQLALLSS